MKCGKAAALIASAVLIFDQDHGCIQLLQPRHERRIHEARGSDNRQRIATLDRQHGERQGKGAGARFDDMTASLQEPALFGPIQHETGRQQLHQAKLRGMEVC